MTAARKLTPAKAASLVQQYGCRVTIHPDGTITLDPVDLARVEALDSVSEWRKRRDEEKRSARRP